MSRTSDVECFPIDRSALQLLKLYNREPSPTESTEFSITRFLTPFLAGYAGWVLFVDNDIVALESLDSLFSLADDRYAVMCVKHDYKTSSQTKLDGQIQTNYPRKNWSSVILWNLNHPKNRLLTPELVNHVSPMYLHRFMWLEDHEIGELPHQWNWLVGWHDERSGVKPSLLHFTEGGPYFRGYQDVPYADVWKGEFMSLTGREFTAGDLID